MKNFLSNLKLLFTTKLSGTVVSLFAHENLLDEVRRLQAKVSVLEMKLDSLADTGVDAFTDEKSKFHG